MAAGSIDFAVVEEKSGKGFGVRRSQTAATTSD
jgi:hypothetical protein